MKTKKAQESGSYIALAIALAMMALIFLLALSITFIIRSATEVRIKEDIAGMQYDVLLLDILKADYGSKKVADIIAEDYTENNFAYTETSLKEIFSTRLKEVSDWELYIDGEKKKDSCNILGCRGKKQSYETFIPVPNAQKSIIRVMLIIYAKNAEK